MIKIIAGLRRKRGMSREEFATYYRNDHMALARRAMPREVAERIVHYAQNHVRIIGSGAVEPRSLLFEILIYVSFCSQLGEPARRSRPARTNQEGATMSLEIHPLNLGEGVADTSFMVWGHTPGESRWIPCMAYLILGGEEPIVVDAGFRPELLEGPEPMFRQAGDQTIEANLARYGLEVGDVGKVVFTHLHIDHTGVADSFADARLFVQRSELQYAAAPLFPDWFFHRGDIAKFVEPLWDQLELLDGDTEVVPGVRTVVTGGHSAGHQMVYVDVPSGQAIIIGDIAYVLDPGITEEKPPGYSLDLADTLAAIRRAKRDGDHLLPMHDPGVLERYPEGLR